MEYWCDQPSESIVDYMLDDLYDPEQSAMCVQLWIDRAETQQRVGRILGQAELFGQDMPRSEFQQFDGPFMHTIQIPRRELISNRELYTSVLDQLRNTGAVRKIHGTEPPM